MNFLAPAAFFLGLTLPIIVALYLLRLRRTDQRVSSTYLWRRMVRDLEANAPWQRLRWNLLMVLQLLVLILLTLALARPFSWKEGTGSQSAIFIIDNSASMTAVDVSPNRLEAAKSTALGLLANLPDQARITVISAGEKAQVLLSSSQDRRQAQMAIESIQPGTGGSQMTVALQLASAIASRQADTEVVVLSDGRVDLPERLALNGVLRYLPIGSAAANQAISMLSLEGQAAGSMLQAFVQVTNYSDQPAQRRLSVYADEKLVNAIDVTLEPSSQQAIPLDDLPPEANVVEVRMDATDADALALDDGAFAVREDAPQRKVLLVTAGNRFLSTALRLMPGVELTEAVPSETLQYEADFDLVVFDGYMPSTELPGNNLLLIAPTRGDGLLTVSGTVDHPLLRPVSVDDPLLEYTSLSEVSVLDAVRMSLPEWAEPVVAGDTGGESYPMIFRGKPGGRRVVVVAFDLRHSDLPLNVSFPILWNNLVNWLISENSSSGGMLTQITPGESLVIPLPEGVTKAMITRPDGSSTTLQSDGSEVTYGDTAQIGLYAVQLGDARAAFAVNLFSPQESTLEPLQALPGIESTGGGPGELQQARREWWRLLALAALGVLTAEWLLYNRAGLARLRDMGRSLLRGGSLRSGSISRKEGRGTRLHRESR